MQWQIVAGRNGMGIDEYSIRCPSPSMHIEGTKEWRTIPGLATQESVIFPHKSVPTAVIDENGTPALVFRSVPDESLPKGWKETDERFSRKIRDRETICTRIVRKPEQIAILSVDDNELVRWCAKYKAIVAFGSYMYGSEHFCGIIYI